MIKNFYFHADWRKEDMLFFNKLGIKIEKGYYSFTVEEGHIYDVIIKHYFKKKLFNKIKPKDFSTLLIGVVFSEEELNNANIYVLKNVGIPKGYPQPNTGDLSGFMNVTYADFCKKCAVYKTQRHPFRIKKPKWSKNQVNFSLNWVFDAMFFRRDFFNEVLKPLGLKPIDVIINSSGKVSEDVVQMDIPIAKSRLLIDGTAYDTELHCNICKIKKYSQQTLDVFPKFEKKFDFLICKTQEFFGERETQMAYRRIVISKEFCDVLLANKIIKFNSFNLIPIQI